MQCCLYVIDEKDCIQRVGLDWDEFATSNKGGDTVSDRVLGRPLWDFITCPETRLIYKQLLEKARQTGKPVKFPFRCDSVTSRRFMQMRITRKGKGEVEFLSCIEAETPRDAVRLLDPDVPRTMDILYACGWCKDVQCGEEWLPVEEAIIRLRLMEAPALPKISHGMCPSCIGKMEKELEALDTV